jgi:hypothetical protein
VKLSLFQNPHGEGRRVALLSTRHAIDNTPTAFCDKSNGYFRAGASDRLNVKEFTASIRNNQVIALCVDRDYIFGIRPN